MTVRKAPASNTGRSRPAQLGCDAVTDYAGVVLVCHLGPGHAGEWHHDMTDGIEWRVEARPASSGKG